ncbi:DUF1804 family protein [Methylocystis sp. S23]
MARDEQKLRDLRKAYVVDGQSLPLAALAAGVPDGTARRWKREASERGDDWDRARAAQTIQGAGRDSLLTKAVEDFVIQFQAAITSISDGGAEIDPVVRVEMLAKLSDAFTKTMAAAGRVSPKISELGVALDVLKRFGDYVAKNHPDGAETLIEALEGFGASLSEVYK